MQQALDQGLSVQSILDDGMSGAIHVVGELFSEGTYFIPNLITFFMHTPQIFNLGLTLHHCDCDIILAKPFERVVSR